jgi:hypothetical protein
VTECQPTATPKHGRGTPRSRTTEDLLAEDSQVEDSPAEDS